MRLLGRIATGVLIGLAVRTLSCSGDKPLARLQTRNFSLGTAGQASTEPTGTERRGYYARVLRVVDGDTVLVDIGGRHERVRLIGIDAPEHDQLPWGAASTEALLAMLRNEEVLLVPGARPQGVEARDRYGRLLADLFVGQTHVNREMVAQGHAMLLTIPPDLEHVEELRAAQTSARERGLGIWDPANPLPESPSTYRHRSPK